MVGIAVAVVGTAALAFTASSPIIVFVAATCFVVGLVLVAAPSLIAAQTSLEWNERGVVVPGTNLIARSIGVAVFGAITNAVYAVTPQVDTNPEQIVLASGTVFLAALIGAVLTVVAVVAMGAPGDKSTTHRAIAKSDAV